MKSLFVSWAGSDAHKVGQSIHSLFHPFRNGFSVFLSSRDIGVGQEWQRRLLEALTNAEKGVVIFTQEAIKSPWLIHETAILSSRTELTIFLLSAPIEMLPEPLRRFQCDILSRETMDAWIRRIIDEEGLAVSDTRRDAFLDEVDATIRSNETTNVTAENERWKRVLERPVSISKQNESPFELRELIRITQKRLIKTTGI